MWVVRHGETEWNRERRIQGHEDPPLNAIGRQQAAELAEAFQADLARLSGPPLLYTSDLLRARMTAHALARAHGLRAKRARYLRERMMGAAQGRTWEELRALHPDVVEAYKSHRDRDAIPGSEPLDALRRRARRAMQRIAARVAASGAPAALVVTHGGFIHVLLELAMGGERRFMIGNTARYPLAVDPDGGLRLVRGDVVTGEPLEL